MERKVPFHVQCTLKGLGIFKKPMVRNPQPYVPKMNPPKLGMPLVNLSSSKLSQRQQEVLEKGPKFAMGPTIKAGNLLVSCVEKAISSLPEPRRTMVRTEIVAKCQNQKLERSKDWDVVHEVKKMNVIWLKADKGETVVLMDKEEFEIKMEAELSGGTYCQLKKDPTCATISKLNKLRKTFKEPALINCKVTNPVAPRLFAQLKLHKEGRPLRLIVSARNSPLCKLEKEVAQLLGKYAKTGNSELCNSKQLVEILAKTAPPDQGETVVSLDIVQLFPSLPRQETIEAVKCALERDGAPEGLREDIVSAVGFVFEHSYFRYGGRFFRQTKGSPIGSSLSPVLAEIFLLELERQARGALTFWPRLFVRYVDDHLVLVQKDKLDELVLMLNSLYDDIKYTVEHSVDDKIAFLDVYINFESGQFVTSVFRKPTASGVMINSSSWHHPSHKSGTWATLVHRAFSICNAEETLEEEILNLKELASLNGFNHAVVDKAVCKYRTKLKRKASTSLVSAFKYQPEDFIVLPFLGKLSHIVGNSIKAATSKKVVFRPLNKLGQRLFNTKDPIKPDEASGVYKVPCNCGAVYVGQTKRNFGSRLKEHKAALFNFVPSSSAIARHFWKEGCDKGIKWEESRVVLPLKDQFLLRYSEAVEICLEKNRSPENLMNDQEKLEHLEIWSRIGCNWLKPAPIGFKTREEEEEDGSKDANIMYDCAKGRKQVELKTQSVLPVRSLTLLQTRAGRNESKGISPASTPPPPPTRQGRKSDRLGRGTAKDI